jgi:hypothetical protein
MIFAVGFLAGFVTAIIAAVAVGSYWAAAKPRPSFEHQPPTGARRWRDRGVT